MFKLKNHSSTFVRYCICFWKSSQSLMTKTFLELIQRTWNTKFAGRFCHTPPLSRRFLYTREISFPLQLLGGISCFIILFKVRPLDKDFMILRIFLISCRRNQTTTQFITLEILRLSYIRIKRSKTN